MVTSDGLKREGVMQEVIEAMEEKEKKIRWFPDFRTGALMEFDNVYPSAVWDCILWTKEVHKWPWYRQKFIKRHDRNNGEIPAQRRREKDNPDSLVRYLNLWCMDADKLIVTMKPSEGEPNNTSYLCALHHVEILRRGHDHKFIVISEGNSVLSMMGFKLKWANDGGISSQFEHTA
jgi:hypothetical protein